MATQTQSFENHVRLVPAYNVVAFSILALNLFWTIYRAVVAFSMGAAVSLLVAVALLILAWFARVFALTVQDRVIRLEMKLRLQEVLPADLRGRAAELTVKQLVALRFASDAELPDLCRKVSDGNLADQKAIKKEIRNWQGDFLRA